MEAISIRASNDSKKRVNQKETARKNGAKNLNIQLPHGFH
jgi:hypothetical protein